MTTVHGKSETQSGPSVRRLASNRAILATGLIAFTLRLLYIVEIWSSPVARLPMIDGEAYRNRALEILAGDWLGSTV